MFRKCRNNAQKNPIVSFWLVCEVPNVSEMAHYKPGQSRTLGAILKFTCQGWECWTGLVSSNSLQRQILEPLNSSSREAGPGSAICLFTLLVLTASSQLASAFYLLHSSS